MAHRLVVIFSLVLVPSVAAAEPARIVSLAPSLTETVFALGLGDRLVGVSTYCDYPPGAEKIDRVGTFLTPNIEAIIARKPDIILATPSPGNRNRVESLRALGFRVVVTDPQSVAEIKESILLLGRALDRAERAREIVIEIERRCERIASKVRNLPRRKVLMVVGHMPLIAVGKGTFQHELIEMAGGVNVAAAAGGSWPRLNIEFVIAAAPEVIIDTTMGNEEAPGAEQALAYWQEFPTIPAVRAGRVYGYREYQLLRPGPRIAGALEQIAKFVHSVDHGLTHQQ